MRRLPLTSLLLACVAAQAHYLASQLNRTAPAPATGAHGSARFPIRWRIGKVDPRFNLDSDQVKTAAGRAIHLWEAESGRRLFQFDDKNGFPVNLVYDARQEAENARRSAKEELTKASADLDDAKSKARTALEAYKHATELLAADSQRYVLRVNDYNGRVHKWNAAGGAPPPVAAEMEAENRTLEAEKTRLDRAQGNLEAMRTEGNRLADIYRDRLASFNTSVQQFNTRFGATVIWKSGEFLVSGTKAKSITVYAFRDSDELTITLAHEFGHAIGLKHVEGEASIMSAVEDGEAPVQDLRLTARDRAELHRALARQR